MPKIVPYAGNEILTAKDMELILFVIQNSTLPFSYQAQVSVTYQKVQKLYESIKKTDDVPALSFAKEIIDDTKNPRRR